MNEPQVWTLIGVLSATIFGVLTIGFAALRSEMNARFDVAEKRLDYRERDVQFLMR